MPFRVMRNGFSFFLGHHAPFTPGRIGFFEIH